MSGLKSLTGEEGARIRQLKLTVTKNLPPEDLPLELISVLSVRYIPADS